MNSHISAILLGVNDMERSKRFYTEGLGWEVQDDYKISVFSFHARAPNRLLRPRRARRHGGVSPDSGGFSGVVFNHV
jgi:catechol 2,3-dioxygenase-like lactoylglutathione lyase family enzyme